MMLIYDIAKALFKKIKEEEQGLKGAVVEAGL